MSTCASDVKFLREGQPRRYTLTHNDLTAQLHLAIGEDFNTSQISGWYSRLVRDEVCAEWCFTGGPALHLHCHVSGAVSWFAPARFRSYIFSREMPLVLDSIVFAERHLFACRRLRQAPVFVHFEAVESDLARVEYWGTLGEWIEREDGPAEEHLARVSRTVRDAQPAIPRSARLDGPLESLLELLTDGLVERPRPGGGVEAARSVVNGAAANTGACAVCGDDDDAAADGAERAERAVRAGVPECDCEGCAAEHAAAKRGRRQEGRGVRCAQVGDGEPAAELCTAAAATEASGGNGAALRAVSEQPAQASQRSVDAALASNSTADGPSGKPSSSVVAVSADSNSAVAGPNGSSSGDVAGVASSRRDAFSTIDLEEESATHPQESSRRGRTGQVGGGRGDRETTIRSLERAVGAAPARAGGTQRRRTLSHYVAPPATAADTHGVDAVPMIQGHYLKVGGPVEAGTPSLQAELVRRSRAAASELRRKSRSRTPNGGRRRVSV